MPQYPCTGAQSAARGVGQRGPRLTPPAPAAPPAGAAPPVGTVELSVAAAPGGGGIAVITPPERPACGAGRVPTDVCCVIDISGSMSSKAALKDGEGGDVEDQGLSVLDVVKHAAKTVAHTLQAQDTLSIVVYSTTARVALPRTRMDAAGRDQAVAKLSALQTEGATNIWAGLDLGLTTVGEPAPGRQAQLLLLTDGQPNNGPRTEEAMLAELRRARGAGRRATVHTYGFGYSLDSALLRGVAREGGGAYAFIPDCSLVGTVFVNALANILVTVAPRATLTVSPGGRGIDVGPLQFGQQRGVAIPADALPRGAARARAELRYDDAFDGPRRSAAEVMPAVSGAEAAAERLRLAAVGALDEIIAAMARGEAKAAECARTDFLRRCGACEGAGDAAAALAGDFEGQVEEACRPDWYQRWGRHYLPSLRGAHALQQCNNFKDPGVQGYGGALFQAVRDAADDIFTSLPPPKPSRPQPAAAHGRAAAPVSMHQYYNCGGGCFAGWCLAATPEGPRAVSALRKGDVVFTGLAAGERAAVRCVVRTAYPAARPRRMVALPSGPVVTPSHPVLISGAWRRPADVAADLPGGCTEVFNLVLDGGAAVCLDGAPCATLGHGLRDAGVAHAYFGTARVLADLARLDGWADGAVDVPCAAFRRDGAGEVCGIAAGAAPARAPPVVAVAA